MPYSKKTKRATPAIFFIKTRVLLALAVPQVRAAGFSALLLLFSPFVANAVNFASVYLIMVEGIPLLSMKRRLNALGQVEITLGSLNQANSVAVAYEYDIQSYMLSLHQQAPSVQSSFQTISNILNLWAQATGQPPQLEITLNENPAALLPAHYVLANGYVVEEAALEFFCPAYGSSEVITASEDGLHKPSVAQRLSQEQLHEPAITRQTVGQATAHAHADSGIDWSVTMFGQTMEEMFGGLITNTNEDEAIAAGEMNSVKVIANPLTPVLIGGPLSIPGISMPPSVTLAYVVGYGHQFTFDSASNSVIQQDHPGALNPSWTSFAYHVSESGVIDSITGRFLQQQTVSIDIPPVYFLAIPPDVEEAIGLSSSFDMTALSAALAIITVSMNVKSE